MSASNLIVSTAGPVSLRASVRSPCCSSPAAFGARLRWRVSGLNCITITRCGVPRTGSTITNPDRMGLGMSVYPMVLVMSDTLPNARNASIATSFFTHPNVVERAEHVGRIPANPRRWIVRRQFPQKRPVAARRRVGGRIDSRNADGFVRALPGPEDALGQLGVVLLGRAEGQPEQGLGASLTLWCGIGSGEQLVPRVDRKVLFGLPDVRKTEVGHGCHDVDVRQTSLQVLGVLEPELRGDTPGQLPFHTPGRIGRDLLDQAEPAGLGIPRHLTRRVRHVRRPEDEPG